MGTSSDAYELNHEYASMLFAFALIILEDSGLSFLLPLII